MVLPHHNTDQTNLILGGYYRTEYKACNPKLGYCYNHKCHNPECRKRAREATWVRIMLGADKVIERGQTLRFMTLTPLNPQEETYQLSVIETLQAAIQQVSKRFMERTRRKGFSPIWWRVWGLKQDCSHHQLHVHQLFTCSAECDPLTDPELMRWLKDYAATQGLRVHVEEVYDTAGIANYMAHKNLGELDAIDLPPRFQRFQASNNAPKLDWQIRKATRRIFKRILQILKNRFPLLYLEHQRKWMHKQLNSLFLQQVMQQTTSAMKYIISPVVFVITWLNQQIDNKITRVAPTKRWLPLFWSHGKS